MLILAGGAFAIWFVVLLIPWAPWLVRERLEADPLAPAGPPADVTVLIPARDEARVIGRTLQALAAAAPGVPVIVVDDQSSDGTADVVRASGGADVKLVTGTRPPPGWSGKLWTLQQGLQHVATGHVLLLDADIRLAPGMLAPLQRKAEEGNALVSVCAEPCWDTPAARWLMPAFVYFFKLLYPFAIANRKGSRVAAAAGGVVLVDRNALAGVDGFTAWHDAIIDDCSMAAHLKRAGYRCFIGLTHGAESLRRARLRDLAHMVARTAFVQLHESLMRTLLASALLVLAFWVPALAIVLGGDTGVRFLGTLAFLAMMTCYLPTLVYYRRNLLTAPLLPLTATFFLASTWYSAWRALAGTRSVWKDRHYRRGAQ